ncbi:MAG TPA: DUF6580 family putative transport protein [Flavitalea sp.]|nr:DUF6580 family putative transport protein [Flavitalea sp.]
MSMKITKSIVWSVLLMILVASLYRIIPHRPLGFAPQLAIAIFAGAVIRNRLSAVLLPLLSMFVSDVIYQILFINSLGSVPGFYEGQWVNYLLMAGVTLLSFLMNKVNLRNIATYSFIGPTAYFVVSNFLVWVSGAGWGRPKTISGLIQALEDGLPFYRGSLISTLFFSMVLFGSWYLLYKKSESISVN